MSAVPALHTCPKCGGFLLPLDMVGLEDELPSYWQHCHACEVQVDTRPCDPLAMQKCSEAIADVFGDLGPLPLKEI